MTKKSDSKNITKAMFDLVLIIIVIILFGITANILGSNEDYCLILGLNGIFAQNSITIINFIFRIILAIALVIFGNLIIKFSKKTYILTKDNAKTKKILTILFTPIIALFVLLFVIRAYRINSPSYKLDKVIEETKNNQELTLEKFVPFEWDKLYQFGPYTTKEYMEEKIGFKSDYLSSNSINDNIYSSVFVKNNKVVLQTHKYNFDFGEGPIKNGQEIKMRINKKHRDISFKIVDRTERVLPRGAKIKDAFKSKKMMYYSNQENNWKEFYYYQTFKQRVNKKQDVHFRYASFTKEGMPIITDIYYDAVTNDFEMIRDSRRDKFGDREIFQKRYKHLHQIKQNDGRIAVFLSNLASQKDTLAVSSNESIFLFGYQER